MNLRVVCFFICTLVHLNVAEEEEVTFKNVTVTFPDQCQYYYRHSVGVHRFIISHSNNLQEKVKREIRKNYLYYYHPVECILIKNESIPVIYKNAMKNINIGSLEVNNCGVEDIQPGSFHNASIQYLGLTQNKLETIKRGVFQGLSDLRTLDLSQNGLRFIEKGAFEGVSVRFLNLEKNNLQKISLGVFNNINLADLNLQGNNIKEISKETFVGSKITYMYLDNNLIENIEPDVFDGILVLYLKGNKIRKISKGAFGNKSIIEDVYLNDNLIEHIEPGAFNTSLCHIELESNLLKNITSGIFTGSSTNNRICELNFRNNSVKYIKPGAFGNFSYHRIDLSMNELVEIKNETFSGSGIRYFKLSANKIKDIEAGAFSNDELFSIDLSHNNLKIIRKGTFRTHGRYSKINLDYNDIEVIESGAFNTSETQLSLYKSKLDKDSKAYMKKLIDNGQIRVYSSYYYK